jgi:hypothetical protein
MTVFPWILCNDRITLLFTITLNVSKWAYFLYTHRGQYLYIIWTSSWHLCQPSRKCSVTLTTGTDLPCELWPMYEHHTPNTELVSSASRFPLRLYFLELVIAVIENMINNHPKLLFNCLNTSVICWTNYFNPENLRILPTLSIYALHMSLTSNSEYSIKDIYRHFLIQQTIFFCELGNESVDII